MFTEDRLKTKLRCHPVNCRWILAAGETQLSQKQYALPTKVAHSEQ